MQLAGLRVLVTGATGFLGGRAAERLRELGVHPTLQGRSRERLRVLRERGFETRGCDLADEDAAEALLQASEPDLILHAAALSAPFGPKREFVRCNVVATDALARAAARTGVRGFVHVSTPSVYCAGEPLRDVREDAELPRRAINHYAATKREAEQRLREVAEKAGLPIVVLRPRAIFGPGDRALFPRLMGALQKGRLPVLGDGSARIDLTYVDNAALACELALEQLAKGSGAAIGGTYNVTNGEAVELWGLIERIAARMGVEGPRRRVGRRAARVVAGVFEGVYSALRLRGEPVLTRYTVDALSLDATLDISAARRDLGYAVEVTVEEGVERFFESLGLGGG